MPTLHINKSIAIDAPIAKVYESVSDFHHWPVWSTWLIMDRETNLNIQEDGKYYHWAGDMTGEGEMTVLNEQGTEAIDYDLTFLKPFKSKAKVRFELKEQDGKTKVNWLMESSLPFFLFFMKKQMTNLIGMDYERGLGMLKEYVELGEVHSKLDFVGASDFPGCTYVGILTRCKKEEVGPKMQDDLGQLFELFEAKGIARAGVPFSIYHKWAMGDGYVEYTSGIPVKEVPEDLPEAFFTGEIPSTKIYTLNHIGAYHHLGNAWSTMYNMKQKKKFKLARGIHPFETYDSDPNEVAPKALVTGIHFAIR